MIDRKMVEEWRDAYIYGEQYEVSNMGRVRNKFTKHVLSPQKDSKGYLRVRLSLHDKKATGKVHRLVANAFIPNPENKPQVNHKDTNKENNCVWNFEWATNGENQIHAYVTGLNYVTGRAGRKKKPVCQIDLESGKVINTYDSMADAGRITGAKSANIHKVLVGTRKSCAGYGWIYRGEVVL